MPRNEEQNNALSSCPDSEFMIPNSVALRSFNKFSNLSSLANLMARRKLWMQSWNYAESRQCEP
jgi:hypothetical protein